MFGLWFYFILFYFSSDRDLYDEPRTGWRIPEASVCSGKMQLCMKQTVDYLDLKA